MLKGGGSELRVIKKGEDACEFGEKLEGGDPTDGEPQFRRTVMCAYASDRVGELVGGLLDRPQDEA